MRRALIDDLPAITEIYNDAVINTTATFDTAPKTLEEQQQWFKSHSDKYPIIVAEEGGQILGWASLSPFSGRCAYADTAEVSIYVHKDFRRNGIGKILFENLISLGKTAGLHTLISRITAESTASINLHEKLGFFHVGIMKEVGKKFGKFLDVCLMQKML